MTIDAHAFSLAIRWLHVAAMAVAFGGAVLLAAAAVTPRTPVDGLLGLAATYERAFWSAVGILVMTGVGNAAAFGAELPLPESSWGQAFVAKLVTVTALLFLSVPRTLAVVHFDALASAERGHADSTLARLYGATALALVAILAIAVWLAHG